MSRYFRELGYDIISTHTPDLPQIGKAKVKNDKIDARKLAEIRLNMEEDRLEVKISHLSNTQNMKNKALCRIKGFSYRNNIN